MMVKVWSTHVDDGNNPPTTTLHPSENAAYVVLVELAEGYYPVGATSPQKVIGALADRGVYVVLAAHEIDLPRRGRP